MHRKSGSQFSICGLKLHRRAPEPMSVQTEKDYDEMSEPESPETRRKRIKENDTVENDRHKDDIFSEKDKTVDGLIIRQTQSKTKVPRSKKPKTIAKKSKKK